MSDARPPRQPVFNIPVVLIATLVVLMGIQAIRDLLPAVTDIELLRILAFVPARLTYAIDTPSVVDALMRMDHSSGGGDQLLAAQFFLGGGTQQPWALLTYGLLHANWTHVALNSVWLLAFGTPLARRFGAWRFLLFLALGTIAGALTHFALFPLAFEPLLGASAGVSACMGAALRFVFRPPPERGEADGPEAGLPVDRRPAVPLSALVRDRRAMTFLVVWLVTNLVSGLGPVATALAGGPIAWQAHIGGFVFGLLGFRYFDPRPAPPEASEPLAAETTT